MIKKLFLASALMISAALTFVACSSDDDNNDNKDSLDKTSWVLEEKDQEVPMTLSFVSEQEGYICSSFKTTDEGKEYKFDTRAKFTYQKEGEKYKMLLESIAVGYDGEWETTDFDGADCQTYFTVNQQAKTMTLTYGEKGKLTVKQTDYAPISRPEPFPRREEAKTKDDVLGKWVGGWVFPYPLMVGQCNITFTKNGDVYSASGSANGYCQEFKGVNYDISFSNCSYTVDNGMVIIEKVAEDKYIKMKTTRNTTGIVDVYSGNHFVGMPNITVHLPNAK